MLTDEEPLEGSIRVDMHNRSALSRRTSISVCSEALHSERLRLTSVVIAITTLSEQRDVTDL